MKGGWPACWAVLQENRDIPFRPPCSSCDGGGRGSGVLVKLQLRQPWAQNISVNFGQDNGLTERVIQLVGLITVLSLAPSILMMVTCFTRIVVVLSLLRTALGTATRRRTR